MIQLSTFIVQFILYLTFENGYIVQTTDEVVPDHYTPPQVYLKSAVSSAKVI